MTAGFADMINLSEHCKKLGETFSDNLEHIADSLTLWESKSGYDPYITFSQKKYDTAKLLYEEIHEKLVLAMNQNYEETEEETEELSFDMTMQKAERAANALTLYGRNIFQIIK